MKRRSINLLLFLIPIFVLGAINLFNPARATVSVLENRTLKSKPVFSAQSLFYGHFCRDFEDYFADTFIFREDFARLSSAIKDLRGLPDEGGASIVVNRASRSTGDQAARQKTGNQLAAGNNEAEIGDIEQVGQILVLGDKAMGIHTFNAASSSYYADTINQFQSSVGKDVKVYSLLAPTQIEFIDRSDCREVSASQKDNIKYVNKRFSKAVRPVAAYKTLASHADEYIYFRTDHHWTALGAYYAYTAFMDARGVKPVPLDKYQRGKVEGFLGTMYDATLNKKMAGNPDTIYYYKPYMNNTFYVYHNSCVEKPVIDLSCAGTKLKYCLFMSGDHPLGKITTGVNNGKRVLVIKDSYGNAFVPFLIPHYQEIYVVDPRDYKENVLNLVKDNGIQEVLFLNYTLVTSSNDWADLIADMMKR